MDDDPAEGQGRDTSAQPGQKAATLAGRGCGAGHGAKVSPLARIWRNDPLAQGTDWCKKALVNRLTPPAWTRRVAYVLASLTVTATGLAEVGGAGTPVPALQPESPELAGAWSKPIVAIEVLASGRLFRESHSLRLVRVGEELTPQVLRRGLAELLDSGRFARAESEVLLEGSGVRLRFRVEGRRVISRVAVEGSPFDGNELAEAAGAHAGAELGDSEVRALGERFERLLRARGYADAKVVLEPVETDDPLGVLLAIRVRPGEPLRVYQRRFGVSPAAASDQLRELLRDYRVEPGQRLDQDALTDADRALTLELQKRGWYRASVSHRFTRVPKGAQLDVDVHAGPRVLLTFEGQVSFDVDQLEALLALEQTDDRSPRNLAEKLRSHYVSYGFLDAQVEPVLDGAGTANERIRFVIREGARVHVVGREYPCLSGDRSAAQVGAEVDSFLSESLPGGELLGPVDSARVDRAILSDTTRGGRPQVVEQSPWATYSPAVYDKAIKHLQDLYRSEGYLSATVGPAQLLRRRCDLRSPAGECVPVGPLRRPPTACVYDDVGLPLDEPPPDAVFGCTPDPKRGLSCGPEAVLHVPIKLGPRAWVWDLAFDGNGRRTEAELAKSAALALGEPVSMAEVEQARRRVQDAYAANGFAYAEVASSLEASPDRTRARVRFSVREGEQVRVAGIIIRGAVATSESLIRSRIALKVGEPYRSGWVRDTEERLATLGVFQSVRVALDEPYVPSRSKNVVIELVEREPQYFEGRPGFSTGEGLRLGIEYGHLNLGGKAIQFAFRAQLGYLPNELILEKDVRAKYEAELDTVASRLERRLSASVSFPEIGLGPLFRLAVEGFDVHDNARDFALTRDAGVVTLAYLPTRRLSIQLGGSLERNDVYIFGQQEKGRLRDYIQANPQRSNVFRVPEGTSVAVAERFSVSWDRRDVPMAARRGVYLTASVEHVTARPIGGSASSANDPTDPFSASDSEFLRWTSRGAVYVPLARTGPSLALSFRWGTNQQLVAGSRTYPDRLFFMGGMDSIRGFLQDSLIPEDIATRLVNDRANFDVSQVVIRGGNFFVNPRAEVRLPLTSSVQTVLFLDSGNLWSAPPASLSSTDIARYLRWRWATGTGIRFATPVGPLVFDYGFNIERLLERAGLGKPKASQRYWEDLGAFHFSVGLF